MSIMDFFRNPGNQQQVADSSAAPQGQGQEPPQGQESQQQQAPNSGEQQQEEVSGLDAFKDIWENEPVKEGEEQTTDPLDPSSGLNINPQAIQEAVSKVDFSQVLDRDTLAQISEGGENAQQAFAKSMNSIAQHVFSQSMIANATLVKQALSQSTNAFDSRAQNLYKQSQIDSKLDNPALNHPSAKPIVQAMKQQLAQKYPTASPDEIASKANQWFSDFANEFTAPERQKQQEQNSSNEMDWEKFFEQDSFG